MNKENIEKQLRTWLEQMVKKYSWLRIKFEFSEVESVYMVSFSPLSHIELSDNFNRDAMLFADKMNAEYGVEAPLFTDDEELFRLSEAAEIIHAIPTSTVTTFVTTAYAPTHSWTSPITPSAYVQTKRNFHPSSSAKENNYASAA